MKTIPLRITALHFRFAIFLAVSVLLSVSPIGFAQVPASEDDPSLAPEDAAPAAITAIPSLAPEDATPTTNTDVSSFIGTGCGYDAWTGSARRVVQDIYPVAGSIAAGGLRLDRTYSSHNNANEQHACPPVPGEQYGIARLSHTWSMRGRDGVNFSSDLYVVHFPDGRAAGFHSPGTSGIPGETAWRSGLGTKERLIFPTGIEGTTADLYLEDGSVVHFDHYTDLIEDSVTCLNRQNYLFDVFTPTGVTDPRGLLTAFTMEQIPGTTDTNNKRLKTVTDPSGQSLSFIYNGSGYLTQVTASDGQSVTYTPYYGAHSSVTYSDNTSAYYTYGSVTTRPCDTGLTMIYAVMLTAQDTRAEGPMQSIQYDYNQSPAYKFGGEVVSEKHFSDGIVVSTFTSDDARTTATDTRGDGPSRTLSMSKNPNQKTPLLRWKKDFDGIPEYFYYDGYNYLNKFIDRRNPNSLYANEPILGRPTTITHPAGTFADGTGFGTSTTVYHYSFKGIPDDPTNPYFVYSAQDDNGKITYYDRDSLNRITQIRYPDGATETFVYNALSRVTRHKRKNDYYEFAEYNGTTGQLLTVWAPVTVLINPKTQTKTTYTYYPAGGFWAGRLQTVTAPKGTELGALAHVTTYEYDLSFDANGAQTTTPCSGRGLVTKILYPNDTHGGTVSGGTSISFKYDKYGNKLSETNEKGETTTYTYDGYNRLLSMAKPTLPVTTYSYTATNGASAFSHTTNSWTLQTSPVGVKTNRTYDANLRKATETDAYQVTGVAATTWFDSDANGNETVMTDPRGTGLGDANHTTTTIYDSRNRKTRVTNPPVTPAASPTDWKYDAAGNVTSIKRADNTTETKTYDSMNRVLTDVVPKDPSPATFVTTKFDYYPAGTLWKVTDGKLNVTTFEYNTNPDLLNNGFDLKSKVTYPGGTYETWTYDANQNGLSRRTTAGNYEVMTYDERNRKTSLAWHASADPASADLTWANGVYHNTYVYDVAGRMITADNAVSTVTRTYDTAGRLWTDAETFKGTSIPIHKMQYTYRNDDLVSDLRLDPPSQAYEFLFGYDGMARLQTIKYVLNTSTDYEYYYDLASNVTKRFNWLGGDWLFYTYDNLNRISERDINFPAQSGWSKEHYTYDAMNRLTSTLRDEDAKTDTFTYFLDGEMKTAFYGKTARSVTYTLDLCGNRTNVLDAGVNKIYSPPNALNQYSPTAHGSAISNGTSHEISSYNGTTYNYIGDSYLAKATLGTNIYTLFYDALGRCVKRTTVINGGTATSNYYIFDGEHWVLEYNASNVNTSNALYGRGMDEVIARGVNGVGWWYFPDRNGNVSVVTDGVNTVRESYRYDAFGLPTVTVGAGQTAINNRFLFTGREWNATFGFYEYRARAYNPTIGRFMSEDPKGFDAGDYNLYRYVSNDPLDLTDPMGLDPVIVDAEADALAHQADLRNHSAYKASSSHWWQTGYEHATTVYQDKTGRRSLSETRTDRNSGRVVPPQDAQKASLVETHNHTNDNNDATTHSRIGKFDANRGDITRRAQEVISPDGTQQRYRPSDKPTLEGRREEGGAIEQKQNGKWVPLKDANTNLKDPFDHRNATGN
ncbi:MAG: RHS repeat domain-containing protein [Chthoniobacterales bacterium]